VMLGTMMTVFVRLHYSYKPGVNSGDVGYNDDSICKVILQICHHCAQHHLSSPPFSGVHDAQSFLCVVFVDHYFISALSSGHYIRIIWFSPIYG
jgi:hypothetical protein